MLYEISLESSDALNVKLVDCVITAVIWLTPLIDGDSLAVSNATIYKYNEKKNKLWEQSKIKYYYRTIVETGTKWIPGHTYT